MIPSLEDYLARFEQQWGIQIKLTRDPDVPIHLTQSVEVQLQSMIHEAMSNIRKHAHARSAVVSFTQADGQHKITIVDDGRGFDLKAAHGQHFGMGIMHERARLIGATLTIDSQPGKGTCITISLPISGAEEG